MSKACSHYYPGKWVAGKRYYWHEEDDVIDDVYEDGDSACVDIDLHRYKCTLCGEVGYYSGAAKRYYVDGDKEALSRLR